MKNLFLKGLFAVAFILCFLGLKAQKLFLVNLRGDSVGFVLISEIREFKVNSTITGFNLYKTNGERITGISKMIVDFTTKVEDQKYSGKISVFPTIFEDKIFISGITFDTKVKIFDMNGKMVYESIVYNNNFIKPNLISGFYLLKIEQDNKQTEIIKIIKK
jgi:hypothetical protein